MKECKGLERYFEKQMEKQKKISMDGDTSIIGNPSLEMKFINPQAIIDTIEITEGMTIGDFGCGTGYFSFPLAKKVGQSGIVYAVDILKEKLEVVESEAKILGLDNIIVKRANLELIGGSNLEGESLDWVCLVNMLFQNKNKSLVIEEAVRVLKKGGRMLVVEWSGDNHFGPEKKMRVTQDEISKLALNAGLSFLQEIKISNFHYGIILGK